MPQQRATNGAAGCAYDGLLKVLSDVMNVRPLPEMIAGALIAAERRARLARERTPLHDGASFDYDVPGRL